MDSGVSSRMTQPLIDKVEITDGGYTLFKPRLDITFFVPCFNEEPNVIGVIDKLTSLAATRSLSYEVLIFDDCSTDQTVEVVKHYQRDHPHEPVRLFTNKKNKGVARNYFEGAFHAQGKHYRLVCGDNVEPLSSHLQLFEFLDDADIIVPFYTKIDGRPFFRHVISKLYTALVNRFSGFHLKYFNGCPIYLTYDVLRFHVETTGFGYQAEFLTRLLAEGRSYVEVPLTSIDREGSGSLTPRNFVSVGHSLLKIFLRRLRVYVFK